MQAKVLTELTLTRISSAVSSEKASALFVAGVAGFVTP